MLHIVCCAKLSLDPNSKISCLNVASFLENLGCYPKINTFKKKTFLKPATGGNVFFDFFKAKNEVKFKKENYFDLVQCTDQKQFFPFLENKN